ncbi:hypothetical protein B4092_0944 [Bacillus licheniformis]|jgi:hypothetical protein|uniref:hypothetical protein n=1 Tax=Bacillus licheniformis TaxID=1402 RepID=UPI0007794B43|nr:hypothetical protein [Bacillus licheniformis]KYC73105.1 hypothetical protein B4092_0944 [Bacillus licheniformis]OJT66838.1 hypothetical protein BFP46_22530 [Bacillus licheniformis]
MLKRFFSLLLVTVLAISVLGFSAPTEAKETDSDFFTPTTSTELQQLAELKALKENTQTFDLTEGIQEKKIYDKNNNFVGVLGAVPIDEDGSEIKTQASYKLKYGDNKWKVYWYGVSLNFSFWVIINVNKKTKLATIKKAYEKWYLVTPPYSVKKDKITIPRKKEKRYGYKAEARYTLTLNTVPWGGEWQTYLFARAQGTNLQTGTN